MSAPTEKLRARLAAWRAEPNPILVKELRATFRTPLFVRFLYLSTGLVGLLVLATGAAVASGEVPPAEVGQVVFHLFFGATLLVLSVVAPGYASAGITSEREQRTWESLELSGMSPGRVVVGKFAAAYAAIALVLVALSPVVGIAFLFGGVSPGQVFFGFASMLVALAPAVAFGVALSARLASTRLAIVLATVLYVPVVLVGVSLLGVLGEVVGDAWGLATPGPFFYTEALATRLDRLDTWAVLVAGPLWGFGMPVWFLLASAVAAVRPAAENRVAPLKRWAAVMSLTSVAAGAVAVAATTGTRDRGEVGTLALLGIGALLLFYASVFVNEPALPPRPWVRKQRAAPVWKRALGVFGPGAAGTVRFAFVLLGVTTVLAVGATIGVRHLAHASDRFHPRWDATAVALGGGALIVAAFALSLGAWLRLVLRNGAAARALVWLVLFAATLVPFLGALVIDPDALERLDHSAPLLVHSSSVYPLVLALQLAEGHAEPLAVGRLLVTVALYGGPAVLFWGLVEWRVRQARRRDEARRTRLERRAEAAAPPDEAPRGEAR